MAEHAGMHTIATVAELATLPGTKPYCFCLENKYHYAWDGAEWIEFPNLLDITQEIADAIATVQAFPVGSIFLSVVSTDPATLLGYGTWSAIGAGKMLVGLDSGDADFDTLEETGGAKTVALTEGQMPTHTHVQDSHNHTQDAHTHTQNAHSHVITSQTATTGSATSYEHGVLDTSSAETEATETTNPATAVNQNATATNQAATAVNQNTGGGQAHPNVPPYLVINMWKRTA